MLQHCLTDTLHVQLGQPEAAAAALHAWVHTQQRTSLLPHRTHASQVGYKVPWTAISSLLHQISTAFQQPKVLLWLNLAYFVPSMPALLLHSSLQDCLERRLGVPTAALARWGGSAEGFAAAQCL